MWVSGRWVSTQRSSEKIWEEVEVKGDFVGGSNRLYSSGGDWGWAPNDVFGRWVTKSGSGGACWEDGGDGQRDVLGFFEKRDFFDEPVEIRSVGGDVGEKIQRTMLNFVELTVGNSKEGTEEETCRWSRDVVVKERRSRGENVLTWVERVLNSLSGCVDVGLVFKSDIGPAWGSGDGGGGGAAGQV